MANKVNPIESAPTGPDIALLVQRFDAMMERQAHELAAFKAELAAFLPRIESGARYQRIRSICKDRKQLRAILRGEKHL